MLAGSDTGVPGSALIKSGLVPNENTTLEMVSRDSSDGRPSFVSRYTRPPRLAPS
jgi:hypothetical protein